jgi:dynein heavy chain
LNLLVRFYAFLINLIAQNQPIKNYSFCYFLKAEGKAPIIRERIEEQLVCDLVVTDPLDDLLNKMQSDYVNKFLGENDWPEGVKKDFVASLHTFMATLTEQSNLSKGKTYLYIP